MDNIKKGDTLYFALIMPTLGVYEVLELQIRTVIDNWFVGLDKRDKQAFLFYEKDIKKIVFFERIEAVMAVKDAEENGVKVQFETEYEEY